MNLQGSSYILGSVMEGRGRRGAGGGWTGARARGRGFLPFLPLPSFLPLQERPLLITAMGEEEVRTKDRGEGRERAFRKREGDSEL